MIFQYLKELKEGTAIVGTGPYAPSTLWSTNSHLKAYFLAHTGLKLNTVCPAIEDWLKGQTKGYAATQALAFAPHEGGREGMGENQTGTLNITM